VTKRGGAPPEGTAAGAVAVIEMITSSWIPQAVYAAARLGIADALAEGPRTSEALARLLGAHPDSLHRLLRALASLALCVERDDRRFELTPLGSHLRTGVAGSVRSLALHWGGSMWPVWASLFHNVKTGKSPRAMITRNEPFETLAQNAEAARIFNDAMTEASQIAAKGVVRAYDFSGIGRLVDVGGGHGELLAAILKAHATMRGVLFDQPHVLKGAPGHLEAAGVKARCEVVPGTFFEELPGGADAYLLKSILHDWNDERAQTILANCRRAMGARGRLLIVERLLPERMQASAEHRFMAATDLGMMVAVGGRERTEAEFRHLLRPHGLAVTQVVSAAAHYSVIEGRCS